MATELRAFGAPRAQAVDVRTLSAIAPAAGMEARERAGFFPLPAPTGASPFRLDLASVLGDAAIEQIRTHGQLVFHMAGDTGGIRNATPQTIVAKKLEADLAKTSSSGAVPSFLYHLGDVVYFNGESREYYGQFYEPYEHYTAPIFAIPGNHDGFATGGEASLEAFVRNFCSPEPVITNDAHDMVRTAMTQPNVFWTLRAPFATIIGLYSNVNEGGTIRQDQEDWFTQELAEAPADAAVLVTIHHPVFSVSSTHAGSERLYGLLDRAMNRAGRIPDLVACGHVHNYQRFTKVINKRRVPFLVAGAGGYHNLHRVPQLNGESVVTPMFIPDAGVTLERYLDDRHGFLRLTVSGRHLRGAYYSVPRPHESWSAPARLFDQFTLDLTTHQFV